MQKFAMRLRSDPVNYCIYKENEMDHALQRFVSFSNSGVAQCVTCSLGEKSCF